MKQWYVEPDTLLQWTVLRAGTERQGFKWQQSRGRDGLAEKFFKHIEGDS